MENNFAQEKESQFHHEVQLSLKTIEKTQERVRQELMKDDHFFIKKQASSDFQEYFKFIDPHLPKIHGAVLIDDNGLKEVKETKPKPLKTSIGTLLANTTFIDYPTRTYFLPETQEIVWYRVHYIDEFPKKGEQFEGFEDYRKYWPDNFFEVVKPHSYNSLHRFDTKEIMEIVEKIENKIPRNSKIEKDVLETQRKELEKKLGNVAIRMGQAETEAVIPIKKRIKQLINILETRKKFSKDAVIPLRSTGNKKKGKEIMEYLLISDTSIVISPKIPVTKKKVERNLRIIDGSEHNDHLFVTGAEHISRKIVKSALSIRL